MKIARAGLVAALVLLGSCASQSYYNDSGHYLMTQRRFAEAAAEFSSKSQKAGKNQLLYLMDAGVAYFDSQNYEAAIEHFLRAENLAEIKDYTSLSEEAGALLTSDSAKLYRGEDFEKVLINVYLALAFAAIGKLEDAQVEARKINLILYRMINEGKRNYQESPFARYLSGIIWEAGGDLNAAYVDYRYVQQLNPSFPGIGSDLIYLANRLGFRDQERQWREQYPNVALRARRSERSEIVVFFERGHGPLKEPRDGGNSSLPRFVPRYSNEAGARVLVNGMEQGKMLSGVDIENTSVDFLESKMGKLIARKLLSATVKGAVAAGVSSKSDDAGLGFLIFQLLMAVDQADLRCWRSLPAEIQMLRIPVQAGVHEVVVQVLDYGGAPHREIRLGPVNVKRNEFKFLPVR